MKSGINSGTRWATFLDRHGRLLALGGLSLLLHLLALAWIDRRLAPPPTAGALPLALRLSGPAPDRAVQANRALPPEAPAAAPLAPPASPAPAAPRPDTPRPPASTAPEAAVENGPAADVVDVVRMPTRYRVAMPPAVTLAYELRDAGGAAGEASLRWETDGVQYRLALDGILGAIDSEGGTDDAGISPQRTSYRLGTGSASVVFARERRTIEFEAFGRSAQDAPGSQDGATLLMQLAGIGLADPDQMQEAVEMYVGRADGAAVERFHVLGRAQLATPLGSMATLHLAHTGATRVEIWLAPERGWLPVQLRTTAPDGSVRTQVVKDIRNAPPG